MSVAQRHTTIVKVERTFQLASELRSLVEQTRAIVEKSRAMLSSGALQGQDRSRGARISSQSSPPDALCATFDALLQAAQSAEASDDPVLFALVERALLHAGERIESKAEILARSAPPIQ